MDAVYFVYKQKRWLATIKKQRSIYAGQLVDFINIKLPNDGYCFSEGDQKSEGLINNTKTQAFLSYLITAVVRKGMIELHDICTADATYQHENKQLAVYLWSANHSKCVTIKFEYGYHIIWV